MRVVEIYEAAVFPKLVLESKKAFAARYGLQSEYWRHFDVKETPEVVSYLKANLQDLASHYHALYQDAEHKDEKPANFDEAARWHRAHTASFPQDQGTAAINLHLAEPPSSTRTSPTRRRRRAHGVRDPEHEQASAAGYAAIYAHRESQKRASGSRGRRPAPGGRRAAPGVVERFPGHQHAREGAGRGCRRPVRDEGVRAGNRPPREADRRLPAGGAPIQAPHGRSS